MVAVEWIFTNAVLACALLAFAACGLVAAAPWVLRALDAAGRRGWLNRLLVLMLVAGACHFAATKPATNAPPPLLSAPRFAAEPPRTVTDDEIARGWRCVGVTTNASSAYAMPADVRPCGTWHLRGAYDDLVRIDFGDWRFPHGTDEWDHLWAFTWGRVRPSVRDRAHEIRAVGAPMSAIPGLSRLWTASTPEDARLFTWEDFAMGRVRLADFRAATSNVPLVSAQVELRPNGDFVTRSNAVETAYRRVDPNDVDGDGLANACDPHPFASDGEAFGQGEAWVRANFTNADEILSVGYADWVSGSVGTGLTNGYYLLRAFVGDTRGRPVKVTVGDREVIVREPSELAFLLEKGVAYDLGIDPEGSPVEFDAADDLAGLDRPLRLLAANGGPDDEGGWSTDVGGWMPFYPYGGMWGSSLWLPMLTVSPQHWLPTPANSSGTFTAVLGDVRPGFSADAYEWLCSEGPAEVASPHSQTTEISVHGTEMFSLALHATVAGHNLCSILGAGQIRPAPGLALSVPRVFDVGRLVECRLAVTAENSGRVELWNLASIGVEAWLDREKTVELRPIQTFDFESGGTNVQFFIEASSFSSRLDGEGFRAVGVVDSVNCETEARFTAISRIVEPINATKRENRVVNPCCGIVGSNVLMKVDVYPQSFPSERIRWSVAEGQAEFVGGSTGKEVSVAISGNEDVVLSVDFGGCDGEPSTFTVMPTALHEVPVCACDITYVGHPQSINRAKLDAMLAEVNVIYEQVGLRFVSAADVQHVENRLWCELGLVDDSIGSQIRNVLSSTMGVEVYFITGADRKGEPLGTCNSHGVVIKGSCKFLVETPLS